MARAKFGLDFEGFMDLARQVDELGDGYLKTATENALTKSKEYVNKEIKNAMLTSKYQFQKGQGRSTGRALKSLEETAAMPVAWDGTVAKAYIGPDLKEAPEAIILAMGTPELGADTKLKNAMKVKGKVRKEASRIQQEEFMKVIEEGMSHG